MSYIYCYGCVCTANMCIHCDYFTEMISTACSWSFKRSIAVSQFCLCSRCPGKAHFSHNPPSFPPCTHLNIAAAGLLSAVPVNPLQNFIWSSGNRKQTPSCHPLAISAIPVARSPISLMSPMVLDSAAWLASMHTGRGSGSRHCYIGRSAQTARMVLDII